MKADLEQLLVLDVHALSTNQAARMAKLFDELADSSFERLPAMVDCPTRSKLDDGLAEILDLPDLPPPPPPSHFGASRLETAVVNDLSTNDHQHEQLAKILLGVSSKQHTNPPITTRLSRRRGWNRHHS